MTDFSFRCPRCRKPLVPSEERLRCPSCRTSTRLQAGIPTFTDNEDYFFGEIPREAMAQLAEAVGRVGWDAAFEDMCRGQEPGLRDYIRQYIADASRANWKYLLELPQDGTVLDFGCGWGETTLSLARSVRRVVSMDLTLERLLLLKARARDRGLDRIVFAHGGDVLPLPFADATFDAIVLNGVLEWVPVTGHEDPRECQLNVLRDLRRTLKPTGQLYIGIENRVGLKYLLGSIDEHSQMKFTSLLPRWLANRWSRFRSGRDYRTYTYSRRGYIKLLQAAGFQETEFFCPYPDYREFDRIVPLRTVETKQLFRPKSAWKRAVLQTPSCAALLNWTVPSFSIIAGNRPSPTRHLDRLVQEVSGRIGSNLVPPTSYHSKPIGEVLAFCARVGEAEPTVLLRFAETPTAKGARLAAATHLESLWKDWEEPEKCITVVPRSYGHGLLGDMAFTAEEIKPGVLWRELRALQQNPAAALLAVADWLTAFQLATQSNAFWEAGELRPIPAELAASLQSVLTHPSSTIDGYRVCDPAHSDEALSGKAVVVSHGDLHLDNALFSPVDNHLTGVVDWDLGTRSGLPLVDLVYLLLMYGLEIKRQSYSETVQSLLEPDTLSGPEKEALFGYEGAFSLDGAYRRYAVHVAVLQNLTTVSLRRPAAFSRLRADLAALPGWMFCPPSREIRRSAQDGHKERRYPSREQRAIG